MPGGLSLSKTGMSALFWENAWRFRDEGRRFPAREAAVYRTDIFG